MSQNSPSQNDLQLAMTVLEFFAVNLFPGIERRKLLGAAMVLANLGDLLIMTSDVEN